MDSITESRPEFIDSNQENSDLAKALIQYDVDAVVGVEGGRLDHRIAFSILIRITGLMQFYISMIEGLSSGHFWS